MHMEAVNARKVIDRFHVQRLALDALQEIRIRHRWDAIDAENIAKTTAKSPETALPKLALWYKHILLPVSQLGTLSKDHAS